MKSEVVRKARKCDPKELICWVSACQLPEVNSERAAIIEYALGVLTSLNYKIGTRKHKTSRKLVERLLHEAYVDIEKCIDSLSGSGLQIFFSLGFLTTRGEAFPWQFAQAALDRYGPHSEWMLEKLGFTIFDAIEISKAIMKRQIRKSLESIPPSFPPFTEQQYYNPRYVFVPSRSAAIFWESSNVFSEDELKSLVPRAKHKELRRYLKRMSVKLGGIQSQIKSPAEHNVLTGRPLVRMNDDFLIVLPRLLWQALSTTFHYDLIRDDSYRGRYIDSKGKIAEKRVKNCFEKIFRRNRVFSRVKYHQRQGWPDIDLVICDEDTTLLVECTAKWITQESKKGDLLAITTDLKTSIEKCGRQLDRAYLACSKGEIPGANTKRILPIIVVDDPILGLERILRFCDVLGEQRPYIINIYELDIITDLMNKEDFIEFVSKRIDLSRKKLIFALDEIDYFVLYKLHGFEEYVSIFEKTGSELHYIGHLENVSPTYYGEKLRVFLDDLALINLIGPEALDLATGWS